MTNQKRTDKFIKVATAKFYRYRNGDIRTLELWEGTGNDKKWTELTIHIKYAINGNYEESDRYPFLITLKVNENGRIEETTHTIIKE